VIGQVGRTASEEVIIQLLKSKCLPVLYYGLEVCQVNRDQVKWLNRWTTLSIAVFKNIFNDRSVCRWAVYDIFWMSPCSGHNKRENKEIPTKISNATESVMYDI